MVLTFELMIFLILTKFPFKEEVLFIGHFFREPRIVNLLHVLYEALFDGLSAGFFCKCGHGSKV